MPSDRARHPARESDLRKRGVPKFSRLESEVAGFAQCLGEDQGAFEQPFRKRRTACTRLAKVVPSDPVDVRVVSREERGQRWRAHGKRVSSRVKHAASSQFVDAGRADVFSTHETIVRKALIVGNDQDDIRRGDFLDR